MNIKVGFKICGNCNPQVQTGEIYQAIKTKVEAREGFTILSKDSPDLDCLIVISGCPIDCAEKPEGEYRIIDIVGGTADWTFNDFKVVVREVLAKLVNDDD